MAHRPIRITVNGLNYVITGAEKAVSYKDILCTIAKQDEKIDKNSPECKTKAISAKISRRCQRKEERRCKLKINSASEKKRLKDIKIICVENYANKEKNGKREGWGKKHLLGREQIRNETKYDSDEELHRKSKKKIKEKMRRERKDESKERKMEIVEMRPKLKTRKPKHQHQGILTDGFDKISIYYLNEEFDTQISSMDVLWRSKYNISMGNLFTRTPAVDRTAQKIITPLNVACKCEDEKDSGMPSWESEELSSKDDNKMDDDRTDGQEIDGNSNGKMSSSTKALESSCNEISNYDVTCLGVHAEERKHSFIEKIKGREKCQLETLDGPCRNFKSSSDGEITGEKDYEKIHGWKSESCIGKNELKGDWHESKKNAEDGESMSDFEIINENQGSELPYEHKHTRKAEEKNFPVKNEKNVYELDRTIFTGIEIDHSTATDGNKSKLSLENRGSFIIIDFDIKDIESRKETKNDDGVDNIVRDIVKREINGHSKISEVRKLKADMGQQCSVPSGNINRENSLKNEDCERSVRGEYIRGTTDEGSLAMEKQEERCIAEINSKIKTIREQTENVPQLGKVAELCEIKRGNVYIESRSVHSECVKENRTTTVEDCKCQANQKESKSSSTVRDEMRPFCNKATEASEECENEEERSLGHSNDKTYIDEERDLLIVKGHEGSRKMHVTGNIVGSIVCKYSNDTEILLEEESESKGPLIKQFILEFAEEIKKREVRTFSNEKFRDEIQSESAITTGANENWKERKGICTKYTDICEKVHEVSKKILYLDLVTECKKKELEDLKTEKDDEDLDDNETTIVTDLMEFRKHLKEVTATARKQRLQLYKNEVELEQMESVLAKKRLFVKTLEHLMAFDRYENVPRRLLKNHDKKRNAKCTSKCDN